MCCCKISRALDRRRKGLTSGQLSTLLFDGLALFCSRVIELPLYCLGFVHGLDLGVEYTVSNLFLIRIGIVFGTAKRKPK